MLLLLCLVVFQGVVKADEVYEPVKLTDTPQNVYVEILPRVELLSGVLSQTSWIKRRGPQGRGNNYYRELKSFFDQYKEHEAVKIAQNLTNKGFTYDAPPNYILSLGPLPELELENEYSDYLLRRAGDKQVLEDFRIALIDLAHQANFKSFFKDKRNKLLKDIDSTINYFDAKKVIDWERKFFGWSGDEFHLVFAPAMFPGGGYGATIAKGNGRKIVYQVIRENGSSITEPEFPTGTSLELLALHEWGHSFINPSVAKYNTLIDVLNLSDFYKPVKKIMRKQAYGSVETFFNEQLLRAVTILAVGDLYDEQLYNKRLTYNIEKGFYLTEFTIEQLKYYRNHRDEYKTFDEFIPYLFMKYNENQQDLLKVVKYNNWVLKEGILLFAIIIFLVYLVSWQKKKE